MVTLRDQPFELLLCDLGPADGSGHQLALAAFGKVPAIALNGYGRTNLEDSLAAGFIAHLARPFVMAEFEL